MDHGRQLGLINPANLQFPITILGAGGVGSPTALALAKMGCGQLTVWDGDIVEEVNTASQLYGMPYLALAKVEALANIVGMLTGITLKQENRFWEEQLIDAHLIISAIDSMEARKRLYNKHKHSPLWFIDARMGGNTLILYAFNLSDSAPCAEYEKTLYSDDEADPLPCTERAVVYNTFTSGGLIASLVARIANKQTVPFETVVDLLNFRMEA